MIQKPRPLTPVTLAVSLFLLSLGLVGCASSKKADPAVPNPFAVSGTGAATQLKINSLRVFGDSYSDPLFTNSIGTVNWASELGKETSASSVGNYAIGGARAAPVNTRAFTFQIDNMLKANNGTWADGDLTVIYLGHNDINSNGSIDNLARAKGAYAAGMKRLVDMGAAAPNRRLFVAQIHDWSRNPRSVDKVKVHNEVLAWNQYLGELANTDPNIIAVDMYTVFERIFNEPQRYGFVNVSTADAKRSGKDVLYHDASHFGSRGQMVIERVYKHYLTRAWDWSNTVNSGSETALRLGQDIDQSILSFNGTSGSVSGQAFNLLVINGSSSAQAQDGRVFNRHLINNDPRAQAFAGQAAPKGLALDFTASNSLGQTPARFGLAVTQNDVARKLASTEDRSAQRLNSTGTTLYWMQPVSDFLFTSQFSQLQLSLDRQSQDELLQRSVNNQSTGSTWSFEQKIRRTLGNDYLSFTPWISLTHQSHSLKPSMTRTLYTSDTYYSGSRSRDLLSGLGFDLQFLPLELGQGRKLFLSGGVKHTQSLYREAVQVSMQESAQQGFTQRETVARGKISSTLLGLNASLDLSRDVQLSGSYAADLQKPKSSQSLNLLAHLRF